MREIVSLGTRMGEQRTIRRHQRLLFAFQHIAKKHGGALTTIEVPEDDNFPFVFQFKGEETPRGDELLFVFPMRDIFLQSNVLAFIQQHIKSRITGELTITLLFNKAAERHVAQILEATGYKKYAQIKFFEHEDSKYVIDWEPGSAVVA